MSLKKSQDVYPTSAPFFRYFFGIRSTRRQNHQGLGFLRLLFCLILIGQSGWLLAQSSDSGNSAAAADPQALVEELEKKLEEQKKELEAAIEQRDSTRAEQEKIQEQLEAESQARDEQAEKLLDLCQKYNAASTGVSIDCEKELGE